VHSLGNNVLESPCLHGAGVIGRVSVADASLSLSLSGSSPSPLRPALAGRPGSPQGGLGRAGRLGSRSLRRSLSRRPGSPEGGNGSRGLQTHCCGDVSWPVERKARFGHSRALGASAASSSSAVVGPCAREGLVLFVGCSASCRFS